MDGEVEERIEDYLNEQVQKFEGKIKVRQSETLLNNISLSMNQCLYMATGEWTIFLDQDDELAPHALLELAKTIAVHPDLQTENCSPLSGNASGRACGTP